MRWRQENRDRKGIIKKINKKSNENGEETNKNCFNKKKWSEFATKDKRDFYTT